MRKRERTVEPCEELRGHEDRGHEREDVERAVGSVVLHCAVVLAQAAGSGQHLVHLHSRPRERERAVRDVRERGREVCS